MQPIYKADNTASDSGVRRRTAFVMAGGGSLGAVEVGMLQALLECGETPAFLVGASAGAINAAYFAADASADGAVQLENLWCEIKRRDVFPITLRSVVGLLRRRAHLVDADGLRRLLERNLGYRLLEEAPMPIHVVASDMQNGQEVLLSEGSVVDAVLASAAIPGVFPPVNIGGRLLVDGGVANNTPISSAIELGATRIIVLPTGFSCALNRVPAGAIGRALHALGLLVSRQLVQDAERLADSAIELRIVPSLCPLDISPYDYSAARTLIARAKTVAREWIDDGGLERPAVPQQLQTHEH